MSSKGSTLFFCLESADAVNRLMARLDAARRLKVASIENNGSVFQTEEAVAGAGSGIAPGEQGTKVMSWGVGILLGIGKDGINGMSVPQRIKDLRAGCVSRCPTHFAARSAAAACSSAPPPAPPRRVCPAAPPACPPRPHSKI